MSKRPATADNKFNLSHFTDREQIVGMFKKFLHSAQDSNSLLAVRGNSGTGKTYLITFLTKRVCPKDWRSERITFTPLEVPDYYSILTELERVIKDCVPNESLQRYYTRKDECYLKYKDPINLTINENLTVSNQSTVSGSNQKVQIEGLGGLSRRLRDELSDALIELSQARECSFCLFIDGFERLIETKPELVNWLFGKILSRLAKASPRPLRVVICGWECPDDIEVEPFTIKCAELKDFDQVLVHLYLKKRKVFDSTTDLSPREREELVETFYKLTEGHPLVLELAVAYFYELPPDQRTAKSLQIKKKLIDERARTKFFNERLLKRLREPYRTLLERGPILRSFDQGALQTLLGVKTTGAATKLNELDDESYERFLQYPFINRKSEEEIDYGFHNLVRRVRLEALRLLPQTKEQLHCEMADFYMERVDAEREWEMFSEGLGFNRDNAEWLVEIPDEKFKALLEWFYHILQVRKHQSGAFNIWEALIEEAMSRGRRQRAGLLLELVRQIAEEGDPFLSTISDPYHRYLNLYGRFLRQEQGSQRISSSWEISSASPTLSTTFGAIYSSQGEGALSFKEQLDYPADVAAFPDEIDIDYSEG